MRYSDIDDVYYDAAGNLIGILRTETKVDPVKVDRILECCYNRAQIEKAVEELIELAEVLIKDINKPEEHIRDNLYDEVADVEIMIAQLKEIYKLDLGKLQNVIDQKLDRTLNRLGCEE